MGAWGSPPSFTWKYWPSSTNFGYVGKEGIEEWCASQTQLAHVVELVNSEVSVHHRYGNVVAAIKRLMRQDWECALFHTLKERNFSDDFLTKMGARSDSRLTRFEVAHVFFWVHEGIPHPIAKN